MIGNIYEKLNLQYSLQDMVCIADIKTEQDKQQAQENNYYVGFTAEEWQSKFPYIPAEKVFCPKTVLFPANLLYYDRRKAVLLDTQICGTMSLNPQQKQGSDSKYEQNLLNEIKKLECYHRDRNYRHLLMYNFSEGSGNISMQLICDILREDEPGSDIYDAFIDFYSLSDCGTKLLMSQPGAFERLMSCRSEAQKNETLQSLIEYPDEIVVYRGEGSQSSDYTQALSWTTDINKAYFFASWRSQGERSRIITAKVSKNNIIAYLTDRKESEMLVPPSAVYDVNITPCVEISWFKEVICGNLSWMADTNFNDLTAQELYLAVENAYKSKPTKSDDHPKNHTVRVAFMTSYLYRTAIASEVVGADRNRKNLITRIYFKLMQAIVWHDIGRIYDGIDVDHGAVGYAIFLEHNYKADKIIEFFMTYHCRPDDEAYAYFRKIFSRRQGSDIIWTAFQLLKDADALDRWRFGNMSKDFVDVNMLRNPLSQQLMPVAAALQNQI